MEDLPYIDEHSIVIGATPERVWSALVSVLRTDLGGAPKPLARLLDLAPGQWHGDWHRDVRLGDAMPGFQVAEVLLARRLKLSGQHRFSRYELLLELEANDTGCTLSAQTWAGFPGVTGHVYRGLVIGSRAHQLIVRRMLRRIARRA